MLTVLELGGEWRMREADAAAWLPAQVPGTVLTDLLRSGQIADPFYRQNEDTARALSYKEYEYEREFEVSAAVLDAEHAELVFEGLDTLVWEFFECAMDQFFLLDMQKDAVIHSISSVMLDPTGGNTPTIIRDIADVIVVTGSGEEISLGLGGYLDVGILDTMKDLFVNFIGAVVFSFIGYFYVKSRGKGRFARRFIPQVVDIQPEDQEPWTPKLLKKSKKNRSDKE